MSKLVPEVRNRKGMRVEIELGQFCSGSRGNLNYYLLIQKETMETKQEGMQNKTKYFEDNIVAYWIIFIIK